MVYQIPSAPVLGDKIKRQDQRKGRDKSGRRVTGEIEAREEDEHHHEAHVEHQEHSRDKETDQFFKRLARIF